MRIAKKPSYLRHAATGQARCVVNGKTIYLGVYGTPESRARYDDLVAEWFARSGDVRAFTLTVDDLVLLYMGHVREHYRKNGQETSEVNNARVALRYLVANFGRTLAHDFGPRALKEVRQAMIDAGPPSVSLGGR